MKFQKNKKKNFLKKFKIDFSFENLQRQKLFIFFFFLITLKSMEWV
jgi:hypothetical protein